MLSALEAAHLVQLPYAAPAPSNHLHLPAAHSAGLPGARRRPTGGAAAPPPQPLPGSHAHAAPLLLVVPG
jgi:hypothetical protein